jgi:hypothetical protein
MPAIHQINWDRLGPTASDCDRELCALWPSPVDHDACFQAAGFDDFADRNDDWDAEWRDIVTRAVEYLTRYGLPVLKQAVDAHREEEQLSWWQRLRGQRPRISLASSLPIAEQLVLSSEDDRLNACVVAFRTDGAITLHSDFGHPILWVTCRRDVHFEPSEMATFCANLRLVSQRRLDWQHLRGD